MQKYHFTINFKEFDWFTETYGLPMVSEIDTDDRQYGIKWMKHNGDKLLLNWTRSTNEQGN